jgi:hypothetical protein
MANYYTYGTIPNAEETVYGPLSQGYAEGGEVDEAVPADRGLPEELYYSEEPQIYYSEEPQIYYSEEPQIYYSEQPQPNYNLFVEGADVPQGTGLNMGALDQLFANLRKTEELQKMALEPGLLQQGFTGATGAPSAPMGTGIRVPQAAPSGPAIDFEVTPEMAGALQEVARPAEITAAERAAVQENPRVQALNRISGLLEADDFRGAFDAALKAEQDLGGDFIGNLVDPNKMKMLRGPMDAQEITKFYNEMPQKVFEERYLGPGNEFKKEQAIERNVAALGGEAGYADPTLGVKKEETLLGKLPIKELAALAAAAMGATAIPGLFGAGTTGGTAAGGATAAGGTTAAGATGAGALTGVIPSGLIPGAVSAAGLGTATFPIVAGAGLTGAQLAALGAGALGAGSAISSGGGATTASTTTPLPEAPLEEVVVTGNRALDPALRGLIPTSLASTNLMQGVSDIPTDIYGQPEAVEPAEQPKQEPAQDNLEQVLIQTGKVQPGVLDLAAIGTGGLSAADLLRGYTEPALRPYEELPLETEAPVEEEVVVTGSKATPIDLAGVGAGGLTAAQLLQGYTQPDIRPYEQTATEPSPEETKEPFEDRLDEVVVTGSKYQPGILDLGAIGAGGLTAADLLKGFTEPTLRPYEELPPEGEPVEEVVVKGTKPTPIDLAGIGVGGLTAAQLVQGFTQPKVDPLTGELKEPSKTEQELDKIQADLAAASTTPSSSFLKDLIDKYGSVENALKLLGALGSAFSKAPKAPTGGAGIGTGGGMGGALPKYTYARQQLSPDIDYYTYGTRPEAKFFDYTAQLEKPVQPELPPAKTPDQESPVVSLAAPTYVGPTPLFVEPGMATGGLTGYAKGGSKSSRYVDGPGSGREDKIPALLSDGEYVIDAETLALLGDGSTKEGARRMDKFRANIRKHKGRALSRGRISPNAKSPDKYMGGGLT